jgi:hypothetical protein
VSVCYIVRHLVHFGRQLGTEKRGLLGWSSSTVAGFNQGAILTSSSSSPFPPALAACRMPPAANQPNERYTHTHTASNSRLLSESFVSFSRPFSWPREIQQGLCCIRVRHAAITYL